MLSSLKRLEVTHPTHHGRRPLRSNATPQQLILPTIAIVFNGDLLDAIFTLNYLKGIHAGGGNLQANQTGSLTKALHHLLLTKEGYKFHPDAVSNLVSMAVVSNYHCIVIDTDVDNAIYVFNDNRTYIRFQ